MQNATPLRASLTLNWDLPESHRLDDYETVRERVEALHERRIVAQRTSNAARGIPSGEDYEYDVVNLKSLRFSSAGQVMVPGQGILEMTKWARQQLGSEIGVRWDKFFGDMNPNQIQRAVTDHLNSKVGDSVKRVIARRHRESSPSSIGTLRGFVSPSYAEIPDAQILDRMERKLGKSHLKDMGFLAPRFTDRGSFLRLVYKEPINPIPSLGNSEDSCYGLSLRNSEVGAFSLIGDGFIAKILCANGLILQLTEDRWLYRRHRRIEVEQLDELLDNMFEQLASTRGIIQNSYEKLAEHVVTNPEGEIRSFLSRKNRPKVEQDAAIEAFYVDSNRERPEGDRLPEPSNAYEVMQGIARLGSAIKGDSERQHGVETLAGSYMWQVLTN